MYKYLNLLRNFLCSSLAIALIVSGRVRKARKRALSSDVVTAIYFHNPNKRLFARCVQWLIKNGYSFISDRELIKILHGALGPPKGAVWLSFDDGFKELLQNVVPLSCHWKIPITVFIPSGIVGGDGLFPWLNQTTTNSGGATISPQNGTRHSITAANVKEIARFPQVSIGSHTVGHTVTSNLSDERTRFELSESKRVLESWTGRTVDSFAYPEGRLNTREGRFLSECDYQLAATTEPAFIRRETDPYLVPRLHVGDNISFPEAVCNMVGVWRPTIDPLLYVLGSWKVFPNLWRTSNRRYRTQGKTWA